MSRHSKGIASHTLGSPVRHDRVLELREHDPYKSRGKLPEPTLCPDCGAVFRDGRWQWAPRPESAHLERCPACHRLHDKFPAGYVTLAGTFFLQHRDELLALVNNVAEQQRAEHPLKRVIEVQDQDEGVLVTTTDIHLARAIGEALHHAYQGALDYHYSPEDYLLRVHWQR